MPFWQRFLVLLAAVMGVSFIVGYIWNSLFGFDLPAYISGVVGGLSAVLIWDMLKKIQTEGITIVVSTPYMDEAELCDRVALMLPTGREYFFGFFGSLLAGAVAVVVNPQLEAEALEYIERIDELGGMTAAVEAGAVRGFGKDALNDPQTVALLGFNLAIVTFQLSGLQHRSGGAVVPGLDGTVHLVDLATRLEPLGHGNGVAGPTGVTQFVDGTKQEAVVLPVKIGIADDIRDLFPGTRRKKQPPEHRLFSLYGVRRDLEVLDACELGGRHSLSLFRVDDDLDLGFDIRVQLHEDLMFASIANRALAHDDLGFFFIFVKGENLLAEFHTTFASGAFILVDHDTFSHCLPPNGAVSEN